MWLHCGGWHVCGVHPQSLATVKIPHFVSLEGQAAPAQSVIADTIHIRWLLSDSHCHCHISDTTFFSQWHNVTLLTSRGLEVQWSWASTADNLMSSLSLLFIYFFFFVHLFFLYSWEVRLCEVAIWLAYWVSLSQLSGSNHSQEFTRFLMLCF